MTDPVAEQIDKSKERGSFAPAALKKGDFDPELNKTVEEIVYSNNDFVVYLDTDLCTQWITADWHEQVEHCGEVLNFVASLEARSHFVDDKGQLKRHRLRIAEGLARCFANHTKESSLQILRDVDGELNVRNKEVAWKWYFMSAYRVTLGIVGVFAVFWLARDFLASRIGRNAFDVLLGAFCGAFGALMSVTVRSDRLLMDANAGKTLHWLEGLSRIGAGVIGALLVALAIKGGLILGGLRFAGHELAVLLAFCLVAGASERLVPSLLDTFIASANPSGKGKAAGPPPRVKKAALDERAKGASNKL